MEQMAYYLGVVLGLTFWPVVSYFLANKAVEKNPGIQINPILYAIGALALGGLWVLTFLGGKVLWFRNKQKQKLEAMNVKDEELESLKQRLLELENKKEEDQE